MTDWVGRGVDRVDGRAKVTGRATYSADVPVANVAHCVVVGSSISRGRVVSIDTAAARKSAGVITVVTHENALRLAGLAKDDPNARVVQVLQDAEIHYDGQPIAFVVADTLEHAEEAAQSLAIRTEASSPRVVIETADDRPFEPKPSGPRPPSDSNRGDATAALAGAPIRIDATYTTPIQNHNPMEPHATTAVWQGPDHVTIYDATQGIFGVRKRVSELFSVPKENTRVISHFLGGGFGCKGSVWSHVILAVMAAKMTGRAVKVVMRRSQMFQWVGYRPRTLQKLSLGAKADGTLVAVLHDVTSQTSRFDDFMEPAAYGTRMLYAAPNVKTSHRLVRLDVSTPTFMRAPGEASGSFALESAIDELAYAAHLDPLELRLRNHAETDLEEKKPYSSKSLKECYRQAGDKFGWKKRTPTPGSQRDGRLLVGWGMATATYPARQTAASAVARVLQDGTGVVLSGSQDIGTGTYTIMTQIAADGLALPLEKVSFDLGDTTYPEAPISAGSHTASSVGSAVKKAALAARDKLVDLAVGDPASPLYRRRAEDISASEGKLFEKGKPAITDSYEDILSRARVDKVEATVDTKEKADRKGYSLHSFGAHFVELSVDPDLFMVRVRRIVSAFGVGKVLNAKTGRNQLMGGIVWGIGLALEEQTVRDERSGRVVTKDLVDYHVPVNLDVPEIEIITVDEVDPHVNEIGAKGIGEIGIVGVGAAIANAVFHATGRRVRDLPITIDKLMATEART